MASSTIQTTSSSRAKNFDVFVSFRGEDTRYGFIDHLFAALQRKGVVAFRDDQKIKKGEFLEPELLQAIERSRVFIVVFSKDYASSTWCMKELTKIVDWAEETGRSVLPIFYDVTPSDVRKQNGKFGEAFAEHEQRFGDDLEMVHKWREALKAVTNRCGWDIQNKPQHEKIEKIVEEVINILGHNQISSFGDDLVDMHTRLKEMEDVMDLDANEGVRVVGICGMGGIGKTTLATALFDKISPQYDACCFIDDLSKIYGEFGPTGAQKQLLCQALNQENIVIKGLSQGTMLVRTRLCNIKTLIVIDNVERVEQLEKLALYPKYLGAGSRIIILSRDCHVLRNYGVNEIYNVKLLSRNDALQLFCRKAFKSDYILNGNDELTYDTLKYVNGLPLAIKVLGSFLFDRDYSEWKSVLARLKENPNKDIMNVLRMSFDGLEETEKEIFLDIACFFHHEFVGDVKEFLTTRGLHPDIGMKVLIEKSLISCSSQHILMHDLLRELGKNIVREESPKEPRKWSRIWDRKDLHDVMMENKEAEILEAVVIKLNGYDYQKAKLLRVDGLTRMNNLIWNKLRYISWNEYPFTSLPSRFHPNQLVELKLSHSNIKQLWKGTKYLPSLKKIDLSYSKNLFEMPDLRGVPRLTDLNLAGCTKIVQIDPSIGILKELVSLNMANCENLLLNLHIIFGISSLKRLNLSGCSKLLNNRVLQKARETEDLENVDENRSAIQLSTSSVYQMLMLPFYFFSSRKYEESLCLLVPYLSRFPCLIRLDLSFCNLLQIPDSIGNLHSLEDLNLGGNKFVTLPNTINQLSRLQYLNLEHCKQLKYWPELPTTQEKIPDKYYGELCIFNCPNLSEMEHFYRMVFSWMIKIFKVHWQSSLSFNRLHIAIPGTQIPSWFGKQNVGDSISMDQSNVVEDPNWLGVACCSLLVAHPHPTNLGHGWTPNPNNYGSIGYSFQNIQFPNTYRVVPIHLENDLVTGELDHLFMVFVSREFFLRLTEIDEAEIQRLDKRGFTTHIRSQPIGFQLMVKSNGYRWVFKEDIQQLNPDIMFNGNSSSRKRKLLSND